LKENILGKSAGGIRIIMHDYKSMM